MIRYYPTRTAAQTNHQPQPVRQPGKNYPLIINQPSPRLANARLLRRARLISNHYSLHNPIPHPHPVHQSPAEIMHIHQLHTRPQLQHTNLMSLTKPLQHLLKLTHTDIQRPRQRRQLAILKALQLHQHHRLISSQRTPILSFISSYNEVNNE